LKTVAILSHDKVAHELGELANWLDEHNFLATRSYREQSWSAEELLAADLLIILGSPGSVATGYCTPAGDDEIALIRKRLDSGKPYLGICYGSQALALAIGGAVERMSAPIVGYQEVDCASEEIAAGPWAIWHEDGINAASILEAGGDILATCQGVVEVFKFRNAWGIQFHPEVDGDGLARMAQALDVAEEKWLDFAEAMRADKEGADHRSRAIFDAFWLDVNS
jgi:GMP synthase-like glutamine amidotransferase